MERKMLEKLLSWKENRNKKPLIVKGARQVGKTYLIRSFAKIHYENFVEINFERQAEFVNLFQKTKNPKELLDYLQLSFLNIRFDETTLLFLDEIQACSEAITALKFLAEEFPCDVICSGSALGVAFATTSSFPVGYVETITLYPMSFTEVLKAMNLPISMFQQLEDACKNKNPLPEVIHLKMNELFQTYLIIGGMPEVVKTYIETSSYRDALMVQRRIVADYYNDMVKYAPNNDRIKARECFASIPLQLAKDNKKFQYRVVKEGYNARYYDSSLRWLEDSNLILKVHRLKTIEKPLQAFAELAIFKVYMADTGLLISQFEESDIKELVSGNLGLYKGALYENLVAQMFQRYGKKCYYFEPNASTEIDFIITYNGLITPIEIKSGMNTRAISLHNFVEKYHSEQAYCFSMKHQAMKGKGPLYYYPLYLLEFLLQEEEQVLN